MKDIDINEIVKSFLPTIVSENYTNNDLNNLVLLFDNYIKMIGLKEINLPKEDNFLSDLQLEVQEEIKHVMNILQSRVVSYLNYTLPQQIKTKQ